MPELPREDLQMRRMFEDAHRDPELKRKLLLEPQEVAQKYDVELGELEVEQLKQIGTFVQVADDILHGSLYPVCDPRVCYPVTVWRNQTIIDLIRKWRIFYPPYYPAPDFDLRRRFHR